jgi:divalent metal cation (Fe/Co/Zn/Cd) transporter
MQTLTSSTCDCKGSCKWAGGGTLRFEAVKRALQLEYLTVVWNVAEGVIAVTAALLAGSVAVLAFGIDSFVECSSAGVMIWRLRAEQNLKVNHAQLEATEHRAKRLIAGSLVLLSVYVTVDACRTLWLRERPEFTAVGVGMLAVSIAVMLWLARAKRQLAAELRSEALRTDAFQTTACWWLSVAALLGVTLNGLLGWWWADPVAALVIAGLIALEARAAWSGRDCC